MSCAHKPSLKTGSKFGVILKWLQCELCGKVLCKPREAR